jgi:DNA-directed RNA polymerase subunit omega
MARVTAEDCLVRVPNRYSLVHIAAKRVRQMREGVVSLREIAAGKIRVVIEEELEDTDSE